MVEIGQAANVEIGVEQVTQDGADKTRGSRNADSLRCPSSAVCLCRRNLVSIRAESVISICRYIPSDRKREQNNCPINESLNELRLKTQAGGISLPRLKEELSPVLEVSGGQPSITWEAFLSNMSRPPKMMGNPGFLVLVLAEKAQVFHFHILEQQ